MSDWQQEAGKSFCLPFPDILEIEVVVVVIVVAGLDTIRWRYLTP